MKNGFLPNKVFQGKRKGLVLLSVLLVSLFLLTASTMYALFARRSVRNFDRQQRIFTARMVCEALLPAAGGLIALHPGDSHSPGDEEFAFRKIVFPDAGVIVEMEIFPLDDGIPLNHILLPDGRTVRTEMEGPWRRLWQEAGAEHLGSAALDFLDPDDEPRLGGGEREWFLNRPLLSVEELLLVPGVTEEVLSGGAGRQGIRPLVSVWTEGKINVNSAPPEVLALLDGLDRRIAADLAETRKRRPFTSMDDLAAVPSFPASSRSRLMNVLSFTSTRFRVSFSAVFADGEKVPLQVILAVKASVPETIAWGEPQ